MLSNRLGTDQFLALVSLYGGCICFRKRGSNAFDTESLNATLAVRSSLIGCGWTRQGAGTVDELGADSGFLFFDVYDFHQHPSLAQEVAVGYSKSLYCRVLMQTVTVEEVVFFHSGCLNREGIIFHPHELFVICLECEDFYDINELLEDCEACKDTSTWNLEHKIEECVKREGSPTSADLSWLISLGSILYQLKI